MRGLLSLLSPTLLVLLSSSNNAVVSGFYLPGVHPLTFKKGDDVPMKVNSVTSIHTQIPKRHYQVPGCYPADGPKMASENLGEFLTGNNIMNSPYAINMLTEMNCARLCQLKYTAVEVGKLKNYIRFGYHYNWIIDNLPSAAIITVDDQGKTQKHYAGGFPIGFMDTASKEYYVYNHVKLVIDYHEKTDGYRVVGFAVEPMSIKHRFQGGYEWDGESQEGFVKPLDTCSPSQPMEVAAIGENQIVKKGEVVLYTYDIVWKESSVKWASRWDVYLSENHLVPAKVHWYSITNSILVVLFLSLLVITILVRNLKRDIAGYEALAALADDEEQDEEISETGWKLLHADVFRPPTTFPMLYAVFIGTGVQLFCTTLLAIVFSAIGFLSPARRGSLMIAILVFYVLCGILAGYITSRLYKSFNGRHYQLCTILTATLFPGMVFCVFVFFNIILFFMEASVAAPLLDVIIVAAMWCCVSIPLVFMGSYHGYKADKIEYPTHTSNFPREIPEPPLLMNPLVGMTVTGIVPFSAAYVEFFFIMTSLWMDQFYYVFGFTLIVFLILCITCAEVTVLLVYYQLCAENHRWWWFAFLASGNTAAYMFVYSFFWFRTLQASKLLMTYLLYFGYMFLLCFAMLLITGTVGAMVTFWFVRKIFGTVKID